MMSRKVAWRYFNDWTGTPAPWSKTHRTSDETTTLCGAAIPRDAYDTDDYGRGDECSRCRKAHTKLFAPRDS